MKRRKLMALLAVASMLTAGVSANCFSVAALSVIAQIDEIRAESVEISVGETVEIEVVWDEITGNTGAKSGLYFTSDSPDIAAVDSLGIITGISPGTAVITAVNSPSEKSLTITVTDDVQPSWIPQNFNEALAFNNRYGKTHIQDGVLCYVWQEKNDVSYQTTDTLGADFICSDRSYEYVLPTKPDESDYEAYEQYLQELRSVGMTEYFADNGVLPDFRYHVTVYAPDLNGDTEFSVERVSTWNGYDEPNDVETFSFRVEDGELAETDIFSWLPDCVMEYEAFLEENGTASVHDNYIAYCADVSFSTGALLTLIQTGDSKLELVKKSYCDNVYVTDLVVGSMSHFVNVYQSDSDGIADVTWVIGREWDSDGYTESNLKKQYEISGNGSVITDITEPALAGDVNSDGEFNVADIVQFQRWLLAAPDSDLVDWKAADFCKDGKLDAFDLSMMKKALTETD